MSDQQVKPGQVWRWNGGGHAPPREFTIKGRHKRWDGWCDTESPDLDGMHWGDRAWRAGEMTLVSDVPPSPEVREPPKVDSHAVGAIWEGSAGGHWRIEGPPRGDGRWPCVCVKANRAGAPVGALDHWSLDKMWGWALISTPTDAAAGEAPKPNHGPTCGCWPCERVRSKPTPAASPQPAQGVCQWSVNAHPCSGAVLLRVIAQGRHNEKRMLCDAHYLSSEKARTDSLPAMLDPPLPRDSWHRPEGLCSGLQWRRR